MKYKLLCFLLPLMVLFACLGFAACESLPASLSAPQNLRAENGVLYWDEVENADGYLVYVNDAESDITECRFEIAEFSEMEIYSVDVLAYSRNGIYSPCASITYAGTYALPTDGIPFSLQQDNTFTAGLIANQNGVCVVPATHEGLPVTGFSTSAKKTAASIRKLYLPHTIKDEYLQNGTRFCSLSDLTDIVLEEGNPRFISEGNCIIDKTDNTLTVGCIGSQIPDYVTKIGESAFSYRNLTEIVLSDGITEIGSGAFLGCAALKKAVLPEHIANEELTSTFASCTLLTEVNIPQGVTGLVQTFANCTSLTEVNIPQGLTRLDKTFAGCTSLTEVEIPESVQDLWGTFKGCTAFKSFTVPGHVKQVSGTFAQCTSLKSVVLNEGVERMDGAFQGCISLTSVQVPSTVNEIGVSAFQDCVGLKSLVLPDSISQISISAFQGCTSLTSLEIPEGASISGCAFKDCKSLKSIELPKSLTKLEARIFENCTSLESIVLPENLQEIESAAFRGCIALKSIVLSEKITKIASYVFTDCISLKTIRIPDSVNLIVDNAFRSCGLKSIVLPKNIKINSAAFLFSFLDEVYYCGTEEEWGNNSISKSDNAGLLSATRYYYSEEEPSSAGNYWHYVNGVPAIWN